MPRVRLRLALASAGKARERHVVHSCDDFGPSLVARSRDRVSMMSTLVVRAALVARAVTIVVIVGGCSSNSSSQVACGDGTELRDNTCVAIADSEPALDAFRDTTAQLDSSNPLDSRVEADGTSPDTLDGSSVMDVGWDATGPEPCPTKVDVNCSTSCGGPTSCSQVECSAPLSALYAIKGYSSLPITMRTPDRPPAQIACQCGTLGVSYSMHFYIGLPAGGPGVRVRVEPPWRIYRSSSATPQCAVADLGQCAIVSTENYLLIGTKTPPSSPARNVFIEQRAPGDTCP